MMTEVLEEIERINTADQFIQCRERMEKALVARMMVWRCVYIVCTLFITPDAYPSYVSGNIRGCPSACTTFGHAKTFGGISGWCCR